MVESINSPRLRNSSINGAQFSMELDPVVKRHLMELDRILGTPAFTENSTTSLDDVDLLSKAAQAASDFASNAAAAARAASAEADDAETALSTARDKSVEAKKNLEDAKKAGASAAEIKRLEGEDARTTKEAADADTAVKDKRKKVEAATRDFQHKNSAAIAAKAIFVSKANEAAVGKTFDLQDELNKPIIAKKSKDPFWDPAGFLSSIITKKDPAKLSISDCIDKVNELSSLKNSLQQYVYKSWNSLEENEKAVLNVKDFKNILDYLLAYGYWVKGITEVSAMFNFITTHKNGAQAIIDYTTISSARFVIKKLALEVSDLDNDKNPLLTKIVNSKLSFGDETFSKEVEKAAKSQIDNNAELTLITDALTVLKIDDLPSSYIPIIIRYMRSSKVEIDKDNINYFLPIFINKIKGDVSDDIEEPEVDAEISDQDFDVDFIEDEKTSVKINISNVKCASQLFSAAIMDMDLDIFNLTNYLTNSYLIRNRIDLEDQRLRQNLQQFVFSNRFVDIKSGQTLDRTRDTERQLFYQQVFNIGAGPVPDGVVVNHKFPKLWKQLIPAVKEYLENASSSLSENTFVSKGGVMQVVSGLQNNLSANCTSMAKIISPIINAEWNFIITKILGHPEIIRQVSPSIGSWKGVAETLYGEMKHKYTDASLVYDKVRISNAIIRKIADYDPRVFEQDDSFMDFCSLVIQLDDLNNSIASGQLDQEEMDDVTDVNKYIPEDAKKAMKSQGMPTGHNDWDF